jgi:hypothetical protein
MPEENSRQELWRDPIVAEVRQARESLFAAAGYDIYEFCRRLSVRQTGSGHQVVRSRTPEESPGAAPSPSTTDK